MRRGSYRLGTVAMASEKGRESIVMSELLILEIEQPNRLRMTPYHLPGYLSLKPVQAQIRQLDFVDTTLPNLGDIWGEIRLPIHKEEQLRQKFGEDIEEPMRKKWEAQKDIAAVRVGSAEHGLQANRMVGIDLVISMQEGADAVVVGGLP